MHGCGKMKSVNGEVYYGEWRDNHRFDRLSSLPLVDAAVSTTLPEMKTSLRSESTKKSSGLLLPFDSCVSYVSYGRLQQSSSSSKVVTSTSSSSSSSSASGSFKQSNIKSEMINNLPPIIRRSGTSRRLHLRSQRKSGPL